MRSLLLQAGAQPVSQPLAPSFVSLPVMKVSCAKLERIAIIKFGASARTDEGWSDDADQSSPSAGPQAEPRQTSPCFCGDRAGHRLRFDRVVVVGAMMVKSAFAHRVVQWGFAIAP